MLKEDAFKKISELVKNFDEQYGSYKNAAYDEAKTRLDFINKFFKALGWDVDNEQNVAEAYREVIPEDKQKVGGSTKAPDYGFRLRGGKKLFFVEAKKPSVAIQTDKATAYQLRRYGRSAQLPISILTNFEEFAIYDCTKRPNLNDSAAVARLKYFTYKDYLKEFDFIWDTFSYESVIKGRFDKFVQTDTYKKGTVPLDKDFLESLNNWRKYLAVSVAKNNVHFTNEDINYVVQQTIDRLIFLRFCEDRNVEHYGKLKAAAKTGDCYKNLLQIFNEADLKYNSGLFDFEKDKITPKLKIDNKVIKNIIDELYYPKCEYEFSVMPVEILGNAYEQFLGKVIRVTTGHIVKIEDKPEVRKAGGVYYTPQYIVEYIVKNTVGKLIDDKTPEQISQFKIIDPACGSGSFLLGAYQLLLDYHRDWYIKKGYLNKKGKGNPLTPDGHVTTGEKRKILLNNIYGVDIDTQAVEVTKLSLLLKAMEGETEASIKQQLTMHHERVLPNLDDNIKCGNSLIGHDFEGMFEFDEETKEKVKPFDWEIAFPEIFKKGGFDVVIGNPPWVQSKFLQETQKSYYSHKYFSMKGQYDLFNGFVEKSKILLIKNGLFGYIIPNRFIMGEDYLLFRKFILDTFSLIEIADVGENVFRDVTMPSAILIYKNENANKNNQFICKTEVIDLTKKEYKEQILNQSDFLKTPKYIFSIYGNKNISKILNKIDILCKPFEHFVINGRGVEIGKKSSIVYTVHKPNTVKFLTGEDIERYAIRNHHFLKLDVEGIDYKPVNFYKGEKIIIRKTGHGIIATLDINNYYVIQVIYIFKKRNEIKEDIKYLLGIINSKLLSIYYFSRYGEKDKMAFPHLRQSTVLRLPIKAIDFKHINERRLHEAIVKIVDLLLQLNNDLLEAKLPTKLEQLKDSISYHEKKINELVYELYGLSEKEIEIIENATA